MSTAHAANRREFLASVGRGMFVASLGSSLAIDLGLAPRGLLAAEGADRLTFGSLEPLVSLMQETPADKLLAEVVGRLRQGASLKEIVAAAALANARAFGGEDYIGLHTLMALSPALTMSERMPAESKPLPVLKVVYRNASRLHDPQRAKSEVLKTMPADGAADGTDASRLRDAVHGGNVAEAERTFARLAGVSANEALNALLPIVDEAPEVHRVVLVHRAWDMLNLVGREHAQTMLRQSLRYCLKGEVPALKYFSEARSLVPKLIDQYQLENYKPGERQLDDAALDQLSQSLFAATPVQAAEMVAGLLVDGISPASVSEAVSIAANQLVLRDAGRKGQEVQPGKPEGSVHGDSIGVHACDSANAWRNIARAGNPRNAAAALLLSGYQVALDRVHRGGDFLNWQPRPYAAQIEKVAAQDGPGLLRELDDAIRQNDQAQACAVAHRYAALGHAAKGILDLLARYATSEDGALHAEKYFRTVSEEFAATRPAFRWRQVVALARVTASEYGRPAPGHDEACGLLGVAVARR
jgi:hypothetical protein